MKFFKVFTAQRSENYKYKSTVFFICLVISISIWLLIKLSDVHSTSITFPVSFSEIPEGKILVNQVDSTVVIGLRDQGFSLVWLKYFASHDPLNINLNEFKFYAHNQQFETNITTEEWSKGILDKYGIEGSVEYISPDTLSFVFEDEYSLTVPVKANLDISYKKQFFPYDTLSISPHEVTIHGLKETIENISNIATRPIKLQDVQSDIRKMTKLSIPAGLSDVRLEPAEVEIFLPVEKYTESEIEIPINTLNYPDSLRIKIFPEKAKILFMVALKDFNKINPGMFSCFVDMDEITNGSNQKIKVLLSGHPKFVRITKIEPAEIEYLILK